VVELWNKGMLWDKLMGTHWLSLTTVKQSSKVRHRRSPLVAPSVNKSLKSQHSGRFCDEYLSSCTWHRVTRQSTMAAPFSVSHGLEPSDEKYTFDPCFTFVNAWTMSVGVLHT